MSRLGIRGFAKPLDRSSQLPPLRAHKTHLELEATRARARALTVPCRAPRGRPRALIGRRTSREELHRTSVVSARRIPSLSFVNRPAREAEILSSASVLNF